MGSLRQAILNANANPGTDTINFNIFEGPRTIMVTEPLPGLNDAVVIDATPLGQCSVDAPPSYRIHGASAGISMA